jgi:iron(III) transport system permease protein
MRTPKLVASLWTRKARVAGLKILAAAAIIYCLLWPMIMLVRGAFIGSPFASDAEWTLSGFRQVLSNPQLASNITATLLLSFGVTFGSLVAGTYFAVLATRFQTRFRGWITPMMVIVAATPGLFYAISWAMFANPNAGILSRFFTAIGLAGIGHWFNAMSWPGLIVVGAMKVTGFAYLFLLGPMSASDRSQEDAAVISGSSRFNAFFAVTVPSLAPAYFAIGMLLIVAGIQAFDMPAVLGLPVGIKTLSLQVNDYLVGYAEPNWLAANAIAVLTMVFVAILVAVQIWVLHGKDHVTVAGKSQDAATSIPKRWGWVLDLSIVAFALIALVAPVMQFVIGSFQPFFGLYGTWTLANYARLVSDPVGIGALRSTLVIAFVGASITVLAGFFMAYVITRAPASAIGILARIGSWVPATAPGIVLSVALLFTYINTPFVRDLFGTPWLMMFALMVGAIPIAVRAAEGMIAQISRELEDAAYVCGSNALSTLIGILARICAPSLIGAWLLISLWMAGTLDIPLLLQSTNSQTVATYAYSLFTQGEFSLAAATFVSFLVLLAVSTLILAAMISLFRTIANRSQLPSTGVLSASGGTLHAD